MELKEVQAEGRVEGRGMKEHIVWRIESKEHIRKGEERY